MDKSSICRECGETMSQEDELCDLCYMMQEGNVDAFTLYRRYRDGYEGK